MKTLLFLLFTFAARAVDVSMEWDANPVTDAVTEYRMYELQGQVWVRLGTSTTTTFTVTNATTGTHTYAVTAANLSGESNRSTSLVVMVTQIPGAPQNLRRKII